MLTQYENQVGSKKNNKNNKNDFICKSCTHLKTFYSIPSMKQTKRCTKYGTISTRCNFRNCKYYNNKRNFELIIGA